MYGFIGCDIIGGPYSWKASDIEYLRRIGEMLGNTLQNLYNRKALQKVQVELLEANKQLERLANIDGLTGIANRRLFDSTLERDVARCYEQGCSLSLLLIDVDLFKQYNDAYGHVAGDTVLKNIATRSLTVVWVAMIWWLVMAAKSSRLSSLIRREKRYLLSRHEFYVM